SSALLGGGPLTGTCSLTFGVFHFLLLLRLPGLPSLGCLIYPPRLNGVVGLVHDCLVVLRSHVGTLGPDVVGQHGATLDVLPHLVGNRIPVFVPIRHLFTSIPRSTLSPLLHGHLLLGDTLSKLPERPLRVTAELLQELATIWLPGGLTPPLMYLGYCLSAEGFDSLPQATGLPFEPP